MIKLKSLQRRHEIMIGLKTISFTKHTWIVTSTIIIWLNCPTELLSMKVKTVQLNQSLKNKIKFHFYCHITLAHITGIRCQASRNSWIKHPPMHVHLVVIYCICFSQNKGHWSFLVQHLQHIDMHKTELG